MAKTKTGVSVSDAMTKRPIIARPHDTIHDLAVQMAEHHVGSLIVKDNDKLVGIVTEQDIVRNVIAKKHDPYEMLVKDVMTTRLITIDPEQDIYDALVLMKKHNIRHIPVMRDDSLVGFLTIKDILKIEPALFDIMVEKFEIREEADKPIGRDF